MMAKKTYHSECRTVIYMNFKNSKMFRAYAYNLIGNSLRGNSVAGSKIIRSFLDTIPEQEQKRLLDNYDEMLKNKST